LIDTIIAGIKGLVGEPEGRSVTALGGRAPGKPDPVAGPILVANRDGKDVAEADG